MTDRFVFIVFLTMLMFHVHSCTDDNIDSGVKGYIEFAEVDCDTPSEFWNYQPYNGKVYAVPYDSVSGYGNYTNISDSTEAEDGEFTIGLSPGHYYIYIEEHQQFNDDNHIVVYLNQVTEPDLRFHKCI
ncbi:MAG: hypothetical protein ACQES1_00090 [Bacteroidota bacterium]